MYNFGKVIFPEGEYIGEVVNGKAHGYGRIKFNNGDLYMGEWSNNCMTGIGFKNSKNYYTLGQFYNGKRHGDCLTVYKRGLIEYDFYIGKYVDNLKCGMGAYYWQNEDCYYGNFNNDRLNGKGFISRFGGDSFFGGTYKDGKCIDDGIDFPKNKLPNGSTFYGDCNKYNFISGFGLLVSKQDKVRDLGYHNKLGPNMTISYNFKGVKIGGNRIRCNDAFSKYLTVGDWGTSLDSKNGKFDKIYKEGTMYSGNYQNGKKNGYGIYYDGSFTGLGSLYIGRFYNGKLVDGVEVGSDFLILGKGKFKDNSIVDGYKLYNTNELMSGSPTRSQYVDFPLFNGVLNGGVMKPSQVIHNVQKQVEYTAQDDYDDFEPKKYRYDGRNNPLLQKKEIVKEEPKDITGTLDDPEYKKKLEKYFAEKKRIDDHYQLINKIESLYITGDYSKTILQARPGKIDKNHEIPEFVTKIGAKSFYLNTQLETIVGSSTIECIDAEAFRNCTNLKEVDLSKTKIKKIDNKVFVGCKNLAILKLPECIEMVSFCNFKDCDKLKKIILPSGELSYEEFIKKYSKDKKISKYYYFDEFDYYRLGLPFNELQNSSGLFRLIEANTDTKEEIILPNNIELVCNNAFKTVNKYVKKIIPLCHKITFETNSLKGCKNLIELDLSETTITQMPKINFEDCKNLDILRLPNTIDLLSIENIFSEIPSLTKVYYKDKVLSSKTIKEEIKKLKNSDNYKLKVKLEEEKRQKEIESQYKWVKQKLCTSLSTTQYRHDKFLRGIDLSKCLADICECTFEGCTALEEVILPKRNIVIKSYAFKDCKKLRKIEFNLETPAQINASAFSGCCSLKEIKINTSLIADNAFDKCTSLENVHIVEASKKCIIEPKAFATCTNLKEFYAPSVKKIDSNTFAKCSKIRKIVVHKKCKLEKLYFSNVKKVNIIKNGKTKVLTIE